MRISRAIDRFSLALIAVAAALWATDAYFRSALITHLSPSQIVLAEDALITIALVPLALWGRGRPRPLGWRRWTAIFAIAIGPQALATVLFTASFAFGLYGETFVLQQTQPLIAMTLAGLILRERRQPWFWPFAAVALVGVYLVVFAADPISPLGRGQATRVDAGLLALAAAALWGSGTVLGRFVLDRVPFLTLTAMRCGLALPVLAGLVLVENGVAGLSSYRVSDLAPNLLGIALIPGVVALLLYYRALAATPASLATIGELAYPVAATLIASLPRPVGFGQRLYPFHIVGTTLLMAVVVLLNWSQNARPAVVAPAPAA